MLVVYKKILFWNAAVAIYEMRAVFM